MCVGFFRDLGAHIDGFSAVVAHTVVIGASKVLFSLSLFFFGTRAEILCAVFLGCLLFVVSFSNSHLCLIYSNEYPMLLQGP